MMFRGLRTRTLFPMAVFKFALLIALACTLLNTPSIGQAKKDSNSDEIHQLLKKAAKLTRDDSLQESERLLRRALELDSLRSDTKLELAYVLVKAHRLLDAYDLCFPVAESEPMNARAFAVVGAMLLTAGRFAEARRVLVNAVRLNRKEDLAWAGLGTLDFYENRIGESLGNLGRAIYYRQDEPDYLLAYAQVSGRAEHYKESANAYERYLLVSKAGDKDRRARIKGLIRFLHVLGETDTLYQPHGEEQTAVQFDLVGDRPVIKIKINGSLEPLRFVLDTGSGISVLSEAAAKRFKVRPITKGGYARGIGGSGKFEIVYGLLRDVAIGGVKVRNVPVFLRKFHDSGQQTVDGYIGLALISKFLATIDYGNQTFSLTKRDAAADEFKRAFTLPLRLTSSGFLSGEVQLEGIDSTLNFIVDTGASVSVISEKVARIDPISSFAGDAKLTVIGSAGIADDRPTFLLPRVTFGSHSRTSIMAVALDLDVINEASGFEQAGILGGNFLKNYRLTFDFKNAKVVFEPVTPEN